MKNMEEWNMQQKCWVIGNIARILPEYWEYCQNIASILGIFPEYWEYCQNIGNIGNIASILPTPNDEWHWERSI